MPKKFKTREQVERMQQKAVRFLRDVVGDDDKADEIEDLSTGEYAERKHITLQNAAGQNSEQNAGQKNAGVGKEFNFHGSFKSKQEAERKEKRTAGGFIKEVGSGNNKRYMVLTKRNPKQRARHRRRNQGEGAGEMAQAYQDFHGEPPREILEIFQREARKDFSALGILLELELHLKSDCECDIRREQRGEDYVKVVYHRDPQCCFEIEFDEEEPERVILAQGIRNPDEKKSPRQAYFLGGNQDLADVAEEHGISLDQDFIDFGQVHEVVYAAAKGFDDFEEMDYAHKFGDENGVRPRLMWDRLRKRMYLVGGDYDIRPEGITN